MTKWNDTLPVERPRMVAARSYDRLSHVYDFVAWPFERSVLLRGIRLLAPADREAILEVGCGTGHTVSRIARTVGTKGSAYGVDISREMVRVSHKRVLREGTLHRAHLAIGDALCLPFTDAAFAAAYMGFTLELFATQAMKEVLTEVRRVLRTDGRVCVVSMSSDGGTSPIIRLYEWAHVTWPSVIDCRPIHVRATIETAGFRIVKSEKVSVAGLPVDIVLGEAH